MCACVCVYGSKVRASTHMQFILQRALMFMATRSFYVYSRARVLITYMSV